MIYKNKVINVLSLGVGVQSTAVLLKYGELFDFAIFADTGAEPLAVYELLEKLKKISKTKIIVTMRDNLSLEPKKFNFSTVPLYFVKNEKKGMGRRFCTGLYKITAVDKAIKKELGMKKHARMKHKINLHIGISIDEQGRVRKPREVWKEHCYPLIKDNMSRKDCIDYVKKNFNITPARSACVFCPYKKDIEFATLTKEDFKRAVVFDNSIRYIRKGIKQYVHRSCKPLSEIDFSSIKDNYQFSFDQHCDGGCGI